MGSNLQRILRTSCAPFFELSALISLYQSLSVFISLYQSLSVKYLSAKYLSVFISLSKYLSVFISAFQILISLSPGWLASEARCELVK
jgi:hypothetical protein